MPSIRGPKSKRKTRRCDPMANRASADLGADKHKETSSLAVEDLPGLGQWYCVECAKWFESANNFEAHKKGSSHKRAIKARLEGPFGQKDADKAIGLSTENRREKQGAATSG